MFVIHMMRFIICMHMYLMIQSLKSVKLPYHVNYQYHSSYHVKQYQWYYYTFIPPPLIPVGTNPVTMPTTIPPILSFTKEHIKQISLMA